MECESTSRGLEFSFADDIKARKENRVLDRPFIVGHNAFAVFTKHPNGAVVRVDFDSTPARDLNNVGPKYNSLYWSSKRALGAIEEPEPKALTMNEISDYYLDRTGPNSQWNGKEFYDVNELFRNAPELKNAIPSYHVGIVMSKTDKNSFPDAAPNREAYDALKKMETPYTRLPTPTKPNSL